MKTCDEYKERIALLAGGDLAASDRGPALEHLAECATCRAEYDALLRLCNGIRGLAREDENAQPPVGMHERLAQRLRGASGRRRRTAQLPFAAAVCVLLALAVALCLRGGEDPKTTGQAAHKQYVPVAQTLPSDDDSLPTWAVYRRALRQSPQALDSVLRQHEAAAPSRTPPLAASDAWRVLESMYNGNVKERENETRNPGCRPDCAVV
jgi:hypothetical protein